MLGIPARFIIVRFIILVNILSLAYSTKYTPVKIPNGTDTIIVPSVNQRVPTIAGKFLQLSFH